jgi:hypothetical protein
VGADLQDGCIGHGEVRATEPPFAGEGQILPNDHLQFRYRVHAGAANREQEVFKAPSLPSWQLAVLTGMLI